MIRARIDYKLYREALESRGSKLSKINQRYGLKLETEVN